MPAGVSAYVPLANVTLSSSAASVTFSSISQAYRDLVLVVSVSKSLSGTARLQYRLNGDNYSGGYSNVNMVGDGTTSSSTTNSGINFGILGKTAIMTDSEKTTYVINVMDYSATDKHKTLLVRSSNSTLAAEATATRWANTSAITSFNLFPEGDVMVAGSTFALYGVSA